jgi:hypothetical protein
MDSNFSTQKMGKKYRGGGKNRRRMNISKYNIMKMRGYNSFITTVYTACTTKITQKRHIFNGTYCKKNKMIK